VNPLDRQDVMPIHALPCAFIRPLHAILAGFREFERLSTTVRHPGRSLHGDAAGNLVISLQG
jgi:hypothetical protein